MLAAGWWESRAPAILGLRGASCARRSGALRELARGVCPPCMALRLWLVGHEAASLSGGGHGGVVGRIWGCAPVAPARRVEVGWRPPFPCLRAFLLHCRVAWGWCQIRLLWPGPALLRLPAIGLVVLRRWLAVALACGRRSGFSGGVWASGGVVLGDAPGESLLAGGVGVRGRPLPPWRRHRGVHPLHTSGPRSLGENLKPGRAGRRHRRFPLWGVVLLVLGSGLRSPWTRRSWRCSRLVPLTGSVEVMASRLVWCRW